MTTFSTSMIIPGNLTKTVDFYSKVFASNITVLSAPTSLWSNNLQSATLRLYNHNVTMFNMGPDDKPSPATSFMITCEGGQEEIDALWSGLCEDGEELRCGWVKDQFGFYWQVIPKELEALMSSQDPEVKNKIMQAMLGMKKMDIEGLRKAAADDDEDAAASKCGI